MKSTLENLLKKKTICSIYNDCEDLNKFAVGYVKFVDEDFYIIESINLYGMQDGLACFEISQIVKIEIETIYCQNIKKLFEYHKQHHYDYIDFKGKSAIKILLENSLQKSKICSIELCQSYDNEIIGVVNSVVNDIIELY